MTAALHYSECELIEIVTESQSGFFDEKDYIDTSYTELLYSMARSEKPDICEDIWDRDHGTNVLILEPAFTETTDGLCSCLLSGKPTAGTNILTVTFSDEAKSRLKAWKRDHDQVPANFGIIEVGGQRYTEASPDRPEIDIRGVSKPGDLTSTGVRLSQLLNDWETDDNQTVACFYGLSVLLQYVEPSTLHRFLHIALRRLEEVDPVAHVHLDPNSVGEYQLATLLRLFDVAVEYEDGEWQARR